MNFTWIFSKTKLVSLAFSFPGIFRPLSIREGKLLAPKLSFFLKFHSVSSRGEFWRKQRILSFLRAADSFQYLGDSSLALVLSTRWTKGPGRRIVLLVGIDELFGTVMFKSSVQWASPVNLGVMNRIIVHEVPVLATVDESGVEVESSNTCWG